MRRVVGRVEVDRDTSHPPAQPAAMPLDDRSRQLVNRVVGEPVRIVAVGMAAGDVEHPLADQVLERVPDLLRCPAVNQTPAERLDQSVDALGALSNTPPPSELACSRSNIATSGLSNRFGNRTVCAIVGSVTQEPPSCRKHL